VRDLLEARGVTKSFHGVKALKGVDLRLSEGEVLALLGENGAGKSALMKILAGVQPASAGELRWKGEVVEIASVKDALSMGISLIHQELNLAGNLDIAANIFLGREPRRFGVLDDRKMRSDAREYLEMVGLDLDPATEVEQLSIGNQQLVEIAKALSVDAKVLIMDEPTSSLSQSEAETLFEVVRDLASRGVSVIYISHRLGEIIEIADRVTVLRDGENAGELSGGDITHDQMVRLMVGRDVDQFYHQDQVESGEVVLEVKELRTEAYPKRSVDFQVSAGEIVGVAGLVGAGRSELVETLFGVARALGGSVKVGEETVSLGAPRAAIAAGIALVPEDRKKLGVILDMTIPENVSLASLGRDSKRGLLNVGAERDLVAKSIEQLAIKTGGRDQQVRFLSGGNQQKVVLAKWLAMKPRVLLLDEPTRGIDVGAKGEIYRLVGELAKQGVAVLFVSSDLEEVIALSSRVLVMHEGAISGELSRAELSEEEIMKLATGGKP